MVILEYENISIISKYQDFMLVILEYENIMIISKYQDILVILEDQKIMIISKYHDIMDTRKLTGMLVVSLRGVNFGFWSRLGCSG